MEDREVFVKREKECRRKALEALYDKWRDPGRRVSEVPAVSHTAIADLLGVTPADAVRVLEYLEKMNFAELVADQYLYKISQLGMDTIETPGRLNEVLPLD
jgi:hypothetical protein